MKNFNTNSLTLIGRPRSDQAILRAWALFVTLVMIMVGSYSLFGQSKTLSRYVTDESRVLTEAQLNQIESISTELEQKTGIEVATYLPKTIGNQTIEDFASDAFARSGIGKKTQNNGVLIVIAPKERKIRIEVGYGLEGDLPDGKAGEIIRQQIVPFLKQGDLAAGVANGHVAVCTYLAQTHHVVLTGVPKPHEMTPKIPVLIQYVGLMLFILFLVFGGWRFIPLFLLGNGGYGGRNDDSGGFGGFGGGSSGGGGASSSW